MNYEYIEEVGLMKKWEFVRVPQWRGWEVVGTSEDGGVMFMFLSDALVNALIEAIEKPPQ